MKQSGRVVLIVGMVAVALLESCTWAADVPAPAVTAGPTVTPFVFPTHLPTLTAPPELAVVSIGGVRCYAGEIGNWVRELDSSLGIIEGIVEVADHTEDQTELMELADQMEGEGLFLDQLTSPPGCLRELIDEMRTAAELYTRVYRGVASDDPDERHAVLPDLLVAPEHLARARELMDEAKAALAAVQEAEH